MMRLFAIVAVMTLVTFFTRAVPFIFFSRKRPPAMLDYLQRYIPPVVMTVLVFASYKDIDFAHAPFGLPAAAAGVLTALLHLWKRNVLVSIAGGTALYMALVRVL
ncbi:MAG: AzlD domain-containing protein [Spirochaetales bacterium]|nr:AzlD domain-containing protein [Spirochaetales bacterium]